ncbi:AAA family ATPase [Pseudomonas putida]|uniref:AAA family ATPase n=1 Tax=Pseudomonas putida TaxID=303 RepID=UPI00236402C0|nr:AAA family ATPase [Pseudomonas putida]MDD2068596.1 AAA family ATPase [Pseudomonas putida]HDS1738529.1 AAA family ATPase [Pseudomonas putida]
MDIEKYQLDVLNIQKDIAKIQLERQTSLTKMVQAKQDFVKAAKDTKKNNDGLLELEKQRQHLLQTIRRAQLKVARLDNTISMETVKLRRAQEALNRELQKNRLAELKRERNVLREQDRAARLERARGRLHDQEESIRENSESEETADLYQELPNRGKFHIITGVNGLGKSRYLRALAENPLVQGYCQRIVCLSGTMYERFPRGSEVAKYPCDYLYFGNKVNSNMLSEKAPFRILSSYILGEGCNGLSGSLAGKILGELGFSNQVRLVFASKMPNNGSTHSIKKSGTVGVSLQFDSLLQQTVATEEILASLKDDEINLHDMFFEKGGRRLRLSELSSGERLYLLSTLALCFCVTERTLVLFDEPENSLHPQWQAKIIKDMVSIVRSIADECTVVIATHSPLIVSSAPNDISFIRDLPSTEPWLKSELYGRNADTILSEQFGLNSPRSLTVAALIQDCLTALTDVNSQPKKFLEAADSLISHNIQLNEDDPLHNTIKRITALREVYK